VKPITENIIEESTIEILQSQGWDYVNGKEISPEGLFCERENYQQIILQDRLRNAIAKINPNIPQDAQEAAVQKVLRIYSPVLLHNNEEFHKLLVEKVKIPYQQNGYERSYEVAFVDFENTNNNQFLIVNQYTIIENNQNKRPDVILFINGLPLLLSSLKMQVMKMQASAKHTNRYKHIKQLFLPSLRTMQYVLFQMAWSVKPEVYQPISAGT
jgi:type I restriction enzyme R subunit